MGKITVVDIVLRLLGAVIVGFAVGAQRARLRIRRESAHIFW